MFDIRIAADFRPVELVAGVAGQGAVKCELSQDSFSRLFFIGFVVIAQPAVIMFKVSHAIHTEHALVVNTLDSGWSDGQLIRANALATSEKITWMKYGTPVPTSLSILLLLGAPNWIP